MNPKRVGILLYKEFVQGPKNFLFIFAIVVPIILTVVVTLLFGTLFSGKPTLGIADAGASQFTVQAQKMDAFVVKEFESIDELKRATEIGIVDVGLSFPADFDRQITGGQETEMTAYVWGESLIKDRVMLAVAMTDLLREIAGQESPVQINSTTLGEVESISWEERLLPLMVMMSVLIGGLMVPASSLVEEKQKRTLTALNVTTTTMGDIFTAKALLGIVLSTLTGIFILTLNRTFGVNPGLLIVLLFLGAIMAAEFGVLLGALVKDINTLFATIKSLGILLYAPAFIYMFPAIPQWIGRLFPTYYMINPVIQVTQEGAGWGEIAWQVYILIGLNVLLGVVLAWVARRIRERDS